MKQLKISQVIKLLQEEKKKVGNLYDGDSLKQNLQIPKTQVLWVFLNPLKLYVWLKLKWRLFETQ